MKKILCIWLIILFLIPLFAQEPEKSERSDSLGFETYTPLRQLACGLSINSMGDVAYKDIGCEPDTILEEVSIDSLGGKLLMPSMIPVDYYITWTYNIPDSITDDMTDDDLMTPLKEVVDTVSFRFLSPNFFMDKNHIYIYQIMACGGSIFIAHDLDRKTFRIFKESPEFACDKNSCFAMGRYIEGADPKTFRPVKNSGNYLLSRDKNYIYDWNQRLSDEEIEAFEKELGIKLKK